ncbi:tyrosine-type recombinase/integrase [Streptomyces profundus]|uniref:tyrosine-type recombinase/integrase n=1 Tax=Streptomyces profundus TaxID=2867410 RepID=UPI001D16EC21|nr:tyrosine-type recombinase/integrase [Streptomyces sp. MA3_2.13]UED85029.1 tyrosine-type recombinase/integrase [Streptomyces sp. MA3_2.13]
MPGRKPRKRRFGSVRKLPSGRFQARYTAPDGLIRKAPDTFPSKTDADLWLSETEVDIARGAWTDPHAGEVPFGEFATRWVGERGLAATSAELYRRLLRVHLLPTFAEVLVNEITPAAVRTWRAARLETTGATTVAKAYRLLKAIMETAVEDDMIRRNPCRIKGAGQESAAERPIATVDQVLDLADHVGPRWRLMVLLAAFASLRPEELAELRRGDVDVEQGVVRVRRAAPELTTGRRVVGDLKSRAGRREIVLPSFVHLDVRRHLEWFAQKEDDGLLFVGERGAPFRRSTFGRRWRRARAGVGLPESFRFYDLRHTGNTLAADTGAKLKDLMVRAGQSSTRAQLFYQHSTERHQRKIADGIDAEVRRRSDGRT